MLTVNLKRQSKEIKICEHAVSRTGSLKVRCFRSVKESNFASSKNRKNQHPLGLLVVIARVISVRLGSLFR